MRPLLAAILAIAPAARAETSAEPTLVVPELAAASESPSEGLAAWARIEAVFKHPRCANCHVGPSNLPMWSGKDFARPGIHGMNIDAGESRVGAEALPCQSCHMTSEAPNVVPHAPPHAGIEWQLAPVEFVWFESAGADICARLREPASNGGRDGAGLLEHIRHDAEIGGFVAWGFDPGAGREAAPGDMQALLDDTAQWLNAGAPCPVE